MTTQHETSDEKEKLLRQIASDVRSIDRKVEMILEEVQDYRQSHDNGYYKGWDSEEIYENEP
jgi:flagellar biosynthesis chaperone FliJ